MKIRTLPEISDLIEIPDFEREQLAALGRMATQMAELDRIRDDYWRSIGTADLDSLDAALVEKDINSQRDGWISASIEGVKFCGMALNWVDDALNGWFACSNARQEAEHAAIRAKYSDAPWLGKSDKAFEAATARATAYETLGRALDELRGEFRGDISRFTAEFRRRVSLEIQAN